MRVFVVHGAGAPALKGFVAGSRRAQPLALVMRRAATHAVAVGWPARCAMRDARRRGSMALGAAGVPRMGPIGFAMAISRGRPGRRSPGATQIHTQLPAAALFGLLRCARGRKWGLACGWQR